MKRIISFVLVMLLILPFSAFCATAESNVLNYTLSADGKYYTVTGCDTAATEAVIPEEIDGIPVTAIGDYAFGDCSDLTAVEIPDSVTSIGMGAFFRCFSLKSISIPASVEKIGRNPFDWCPALEAISVEGENSVYHSKGNCLIETESNILIAGCKNSVIPDYVTEIGDYAFHYCDTLTDVKIPDSVKKIGVHAFGGCIALSSVELGENVEVIESNAFNECAGLVKLLVPHSLRSIGADAFSQSSLNFNEFEGGKYLGNGENPYHALICGADVDPCTINENTVVIATRAFSSLNNVTAIKLPDSVKHIGDYAFNMCLNLASVDFGKSVETIGDGAFYFCIKLNNIEIPASVNSVGYNPFINCFTLESLSVDSENKAYRAQNNCLIEISTRTLVSGFKNSQIHESVRNIGDFAFAECFDLISMDIPASVKTIGDYAFYHCADLERVKIPNSVTNIGNRAFNDCKRLTKVEIPASVESMGYEVFAYCDGLTDIYCEAASLPEGWNENWYLGYEAIIVNVHWGSEMTYDPEKINEIGDVNGNDKVDMIDYILLKRSYFGSFEFVYTQWLAGDINNNEKLDMTDYILLKRAYFGTYMINLDKPDESATESLVHSYSGATCGEPQKCACGEIHGNLFAHKWADATCQSPKTCLVCNSTEGTTVDHVVEGATCKWCKQAVAVDLN